MAIFKRGRVYWYHFIFNGQHVQESTKQGNPRVARQMEAAHRTSLAKGEVGIREKAPVPTLREFIDNRFEPWAKAQFESASPKTWKGWYRTNLRVLAGFLPLADKNLGQITGEAAASFAAHRQTKGMQVSSINSSLRVLRRLLRLAAEWGVIPAAPKIKLLRGERHRERVITPTEEAKYLAAAPEPLSSVATVLVDSGMRPEECFRLKWESVTWVSGRNGTVLVTHGKTAAARRMLPMTPPSQEHTRNPLGAHREARGRLDLGSAHSKWPHRIIEPQEAARQNVQDARRTGHRNQRETGAPIRALHPAAYFPHTPGSIRLQRLDVGTNRGAQFAIALSARYFHPSEDAVLNAMTQMQLSEKVESQEKRPPLPS